MNKTFKTSIFISMFFLPKAGYAFDIEGTEEKNEFEIEQITSEETKRSPFFSTTISREMIERSNAKSIPEALTLIPGMISASPFGSYSVTTYKGMADEYPRRTKIEVDGVPINLSSTGSVFWGALPIDIEDVAKIVFIANPSNATNGSQAFNGVIKITTVSADEKNNLLSASIGGNNYRQVKGRTAFDINENCSLQASASKYQSDGLHRDKSDEDKTRLWLSGIYQSNQNRAIFNFGQGSLDDDKNAAITQPQTPNYKNRKISTTQANFTWENTSVGKTTFTAGFNQVNNDINNIVSFLPNVWTRSGTTPIRLDLSYNSKRYFASIENKYHFGHLETTFGAQITKDIEDPRRWDEGNKWETEIYNLMFGLNYKISRETSLYGAINAEKHSEFSENVFSPMFAISHNLSQNQNISLMHSKSHRFPVNWESKSNLYAYSDENDLYRIYRYGMSIDNVTSEIVDSTSLKYDYTPSIDKSISMRVFQDDYSNLLYAQIAPSTQGIGYYDYNGIPFSGVLGNASGDKIKVIGFELHSNWRINKYLNTMLSYSKNEQDNSNNNVAYTHKSIPSDIISGMFSTKIDKIKLNLLFRHYSSFVWDSQDVEDKKKIFSGYSTASINGSRCFDLEKSDRICVTLSANNLLEESSDYYNLNSDATEVTKSYYFDVDYKF